MFQMKRTSSESLLAGSLFHDHWWLSAATGNQFSEVTEIRGGQLIGRFPFIITRRRGFLVSQMPPFTRVLGPVVDLGTGKDHTRLLRRFDIVGKLIDQLPPVHYFRQLLDVNEHEVQAFISRGFQLGVENTFRLDCNQPQAEIWANMRDKTRNLIRQAEKEYIVSPLEDPEHFVRFYVDSRTKRGAANQIDFARFGPLFSACAARKQGEILVARKRAGIPVAMVFLVWGHGVMYYLLSVRDVSLAGSGAVSLLIWNGIQRAHEMGVIRNLGR